ncbi:putative transposase/invertase (TIGR01784 family) [Bacillus ectoiniformans]|uniref:Rpn family recombination-promoting nuclease/putative transposase n=1 Tax=Bacillus ectoiniformans TaxID=1494429 RepID=UPI001959E020|nr:Rpn family recombination-promoting nuclease/putative transposase [Bacillus ectoiniformans]MBM7649796.1 putative transposase/invertase (TIGR01784 family) [Bacillus ectoiniformans]
MVSKLLKRVPLEQLMDLKIDYAFKQLFGTEKNKEITVVFLNAVLNRNGHESIRDLSFTSTEAGGEYEEDKQSRLDILAVTNDDKRINIEIQFTNQYDMIKRSIYYWAGIYRRPMKKRMAYRELYPVIAINILNFNLFQDTKRFHTSYHLYEDQDFFLLTDVMEFHFLEMPKMISDWKQNLLDPWNDLLARWMLLLGIVDHRNGKVYEDIYHELEAIAMKDPTLKQAFQGWDILSATEEEIWAYESRLKQVLDAEAAKREAELSEKEAVEKAVKEGLERGIQQGLQQGIEEGRRNEKIEMVKRMLQKGMETETIADIIGLEVTEIRRIKKELE